MAANIISITGDTVIKAALNKTSGFAFPFNLLEATDAAGFIFVWQVLQN